MTQGIDPKGLGERLLELRKDRRKTLKDVAKETGISVATLSRIERGEGKNVKSDTLVTLAEWMGTRVETLRTQPLPTVNRGRPLTNTPDIIELHLRADKRLDQKTAGALAKLFRTVYNQLTNSMKKE
jgi:transcriptional regulator with XRE-family HTH domain